MREARAAQSRRFAMAAALRIVLIACVAAACGKSMPAQGPTPGSAWWHERVGYEIFVRSFADSDGDGIGDLKGLIAHLDDLNDGNPATASDLGVDLVWLTPIFASPSSHGYDVTDYRSVNPRYGSLGDLDQLVQEAHRRGIKVILDMVLNHSSNQHPWFQDSRQGASAAKRDWYLWSSTDPLWYGQRGSLWQPDNGGYYYAYFSPGMPDLNLGNPAVEAELVAAMKFWLGHGVDGFRLDAVRYFFESSGTQITDQPASHAFLRRIRTALEVDSPNVLLVAEAWANVTTEASYAGQGDEAHLAFAFDQAGALLTSLGNANHDAIVNQLGRTENAFAGKDRAYEAPFLSNHDQVRTMRALGGDAGAARLGAAAMLAMPGTPFLYYGEELGMRGGPGSADENKRTPFHWTSSAPGYGFSSATPWISGADDGAGVDLATQRADPNSLWNLYRRLIAVRRANAALGAGDATRSTVTGGGTGAFALLRTLAGKRLLFVANFAAAATGAFSVDATGTPRVLESEGLTGAPAASAGKITVQDLAPRGFAFLSLD